MATTKRRFSIERARRAPAEIALALALALRVATAYAGDAEELLRQGVELRREGRDAEALSVFERAYATSPGPRALAQVALAHQALGHWVQAEAALDASLADEGDPWIRENRDPLAGALDKIRRHLGWLDVTTNVAGAVLSVDGAAVGVLPQASPVRMVNGLAVVELRKPGYDTVRRSVEIIPGGRTQETMPMSVASAPSAAAGAPSRNEAVTARDAQAAGEPTSARRTWGWVTLTTGSVLLAGGVVASVVHEHEAQAYNDDSRCFYGNESRNERCGDHRSAAEAATGLAIAGYASGAAAVVLGVFLLSGAPAGTRTARVVCRPLMLGASCSGAF